MRLSDALLAGASGLLLALSFPKFGHPAFGWIALTPLLVTLVRGSLAQAFGRGLVAGFVYFAGTLYWISRVIVVHGGLPWVVAVPINVGLVAYLALFPAFFALIVRRLSESYGNGALMAAPLVWVTTELGRTHLFTGFPWVLLGYSQTGVIAVVQVASLFGVYAVSALVATVGAALSFAAVSSSQPARRRYLPCAFALLAVVAVAAWGSVRVAGGVLTRAGQPIRIGLVQGNVDQAEKWDVSKADSILQRHVALARQAIGGGAALVVWPESSTPFYFEEDRAGAEPVRTLARQAKVPLLIGSDELERGRPARYFNSAFLVGADGTTSGVYRKIHLVPFGEYVPLGGLLSFARPLVEAVSDFSAGTDAALLPLGSHRISTAICYEIVYPDLVRRFVREGSELLTTITNDAWFGRTSAPYQHFEQAAMRAVEEGRYLARAANTGISGFVDPYGRVLARSDLYEAAVLVEDARLLRGTTLYARVGDLFAYGSVVATLVMLVAARRRVQ
jgi:apolipoprotein N-acyltransferase